MFTFAWQYTFLISFESYIPETPVDINVEKRTQFSKYFSCLGIFKFHNIWPKNRF